MKTLVILPIMLEVSDADEAQTVANALRDKAVEAMEMEANYQGIDTEEIDEIVRFLDPSVIEI